MQMTSSYAASWRGPIPNDDSKHPDYEFVPLSNLISVYGEERVRQKLESFIPYKDSSTGSFLRNLAIMMEKKDLSRTFLAVSYDHRILGYVPMGMKCMTIPKENLLSTSVLNEMNIDKRTGVVQSYLLGQLARSKDAPSGIGSEFLNYALYKFRISKENVGCRMIRLDCTDDLIRYYKEHGFKQICKNSDGDLNQMMIFV